MPTPPVWLTDKRTNARLFVVVVFFDGKSTKRETETLDTQSYCRCHQPQWTWENVPFTEMSEMDFFQYFFAIFFYFSRQKPLVFTGTHTAIMVGRTFLSSITPKWLEKYRNVIDSASRPPFFPLHNVWLVPPLSGSARTRATWKIFKINWRIEIKKKKKNQQGKHTNCVFSVFPETKKKGEGKKKKIMIEKPSMMMMCSFE